jgi:hypothetical protein
MYGQKRAADEQVDQVEAQRDAALARLREVGKRLQKARYCSHWGDAAQELMDVCNLFGPDLTDGLDEQGGEAAQEIEALRADRERLQTLYRLAAPEEWGGIQLCLVGHSYRIETQAGSLLGEGVTFDEAIDDAARDAGEGGG